MDGFPLAHESLIQMESIDCKKVWVFGDPSGKGGREKILKIPLEEQKPPKINFYKGNKATLEAINGSNTAFFVNPPSLENAFEIANLHKLMPQKSTYFYPKMFSGLVINKF